MSLISDQGLYLPAKALGDQLEEQIRLALDHYFKSWTMDDVRRYCQRVQLKGEEFETFYIDGKPMLQIWPMKTELVGKKVRVTQQVDRLYK